MSERRFGAPSRNPSGSVVSSARVETVGAHESIRIWNRGGLSGVLLVMPGDGERIAKMLGLLESPEINEETFERLFGFKPQQDDLHRVNCDSAGQIGHLQCGVCVHRKPVFTCAPCTRDAARAISDE